MNHPYVKVNHHSGLIPHSPLTCCSSGWWQSNAAQYTLCSLGNKKNNRAKPVWAVRPTCLLFSCCRTCRKSRCVSSMQSSANYVSGQCRRLLYRETNFFQFQLVQNRISTLKEPHTMDWLMVWPQHSSRMRIHWSIQIIEVSTNTQRQSKSSNMSSDRNSYIGISKKLKTQRFSMCQLFDEKGNLGPVFLDTRGQLCPKRFECSLVLRLTVQIGISEERTKAWGASFLGIVSCCRLGFF